MVDGHFGWKRIPKKPLYITTTSDMGGKFRMLGAFQNELRLLYKSVVNRVIIG
jgi:hypothetical protein